MKKARMDSLLSQESIMNATIQLFSGEQFQDITVTDICKRAGVARVTFYKYYHSIDDVLTTIFKENFIARYKKLPNPKSLENATVLLTFLLESIYFAPKFVNHLVDCNMSHILLVVFDSIAEILISYQNHNPQILKLQRQFIAGGLHHVFIEWIRNHNEPPIETLSNNLVDMLDSLESTLSQAMHNACW
ncbi:MAG: TetR/AcrR family transcriptional regulator [Lachnospiraceae bacterium]|nr:TetR/AcrR family transcriptional regulator [Lachnospiraceae bacterium]